MIVTRRSPFSDQTNTMDLPVTQEQLDRYERREDYVQNIFSHLTPDQREFIMTGITPDEWDETFKNDE